MPTHLLEPPPLESRVENQLIEGKGFEDSVRGLVLDVRLPRLGGHSRKVSSVLTRRNIETEPFSMSSTVHNTASNRATFTTRPPSRHLTTSASAHIGPQIRVTGQRRGAGYATRPRLVQFPGKLRHLGLGQRRTPPPDQALHLTGGHPPHIRVGHHMHERPLARSADIEEPANRRTGLSRSRTYGRFVPVLLNGNQSDTPTDNPQHRKGPDQDV